MSDRQFLTPAAATPPVVACTGLSKHFREGAEAVRVLDEVTLSVGRGERIAIVGASGSGKIARISLPISAPGPEPALPRLRSPCRARSE